MYMYYISRHSRWQTNQCIHAYPWSNNAQIKFLQNDFGTLITQRNYIYLHIDNYLIKNEDWITFINNLDNWPLISSSDIVSINELALILKIISQCDVRQRAGSDTENYQSVWCQRHYDVTNNNNNVILKVLIYTLSLVSLVIISVSTLKWLYHRKPCYVEVKGTNILYLKITKYLNKHR